MQKTRRKNTPKAREANHRFYDQGEIKIPLQELIDNHHRQLAIAVIAFTEHTYKEIWKQKHILDCMDTLRTGNFNFDEIGDPVGHEGECEAWHCLRTICRDGLTAYKVLVRMLECVEQGCSPIRTREPNHDWSEQAKTGGEFQYRSGFEAHIAAMSAKELREMLVDCCEGVVWYIDLPEVDFEGHEIRPLVEAELARAEAQEKKSGRR